MIRFFLLLALITTAALCFSGCGESPESVVKKKLFRPSSDKDVTTSPVFNFSPFTNTIWKTKVKTAIANTKRYTDAPEVSLLAPHRFDPKNPRYSPIADMKLVAILPVGTHLRIAHLWQDQGAWGGVQVEAIIEDGTNAQTSVLMDGFLLAYNRWNGGQVAITNWGVNPDMLEKGE